MPRRPAVTTQADIARAIRAAKQAGAAAVVIRGAEIVIRLAADPDEPAVPPPAKPEEAPVAARRRIVL